jgi:hypothetical protein
MSGSCSPAETTSAEANGETKDAIAIKELFVKPDCLPNVRQETEHLPRLDITTVDLQWVQVRHRKTI